MPEVFCCLEGLHYLGRKTKTMNKNFVLTIRKIPRNIITFAKILGILKTNIIRIGNSRGIVIPGKLLSRMGLDLRDTVDIELENGKLVISAVGNPFAAISQGGWYDDSRDSHEISDDLRSGRVNDREAVEL